MDDRVIKAAIDHFENDNLLQAKELVQGQVRQARDNFIKAKLGLKNDLNKQFVNLEDEPQYTGEPNEIEDDPKPEPKKRLLTRTKK